MVADRERLFGFLQDEGLIVPNTDNMPRGLGLRLLLGPALDRRDAGHARRSVVLGRVAGVDAHQPSHVQGVRAAVSQAARRTASGWSTDGCCEPQTEPPRPHHRSHAQPALVSVTPWADFERTREMLGSDYVFSRKPRPGTLSGAEPHWERAEEDLRRTHDAAGRNDCNVELLFRDVYDVGGDRGAPEDVGRSWRARSSNAELRAREQRGAQEDGAAKGRGTRTIAATSAVWYAEQAAPVGQMRRTGPIGWLARRPSRSHRSPGDGVPR